MNEKIKQTTYKFRPNEYSGPYILKCRRLNQYQSTKWRPRWTPKDKRAFLSKLFSVIHHYSSHSKPALAKRWKQADVRFEKRFGNSDRASRRFINEYTAHAWA